MIYTDGRITVNTRYMVGLAKDEETYSKQDRFFLKVKYQFDENDLNGEYAEREERNKAFAALTKVMIEEDRMPESAEPPGTEPPVSGEIKEGK